jgi:hypothetical protein
LSAPPATSILTTVEKDSPDQAMLLGAVPVINPRKSLKGYNGNARNSSSSSAIINFFTGSSTSSYFSVDGTSWFKITSK